MSAAITAGLILDRQPDAENYGVYFYCNGRLIAKELKSREVGYMTGYAGVPHSDASLCRVIVELNGPAQLMPWNSSKNAINFGHSAFEAVRPTLLALLTHFSALSRRLRDDWNTNVLRHTSGRIQQIPPERGASGRRLILPPLPRVRRAHTDEIKSQNRTQINRQPWTLGLVEGIAAVDIISRQRLETRNRIALILLDSSFEIALKEFIVHDAVLFPLKQFTDQHLKNLFLNRNDVITAISQKVAIPTDELRKVRHYYAIRNKLIHERATVDITDTDVETYRETIETILGTLFKLKF